ncbi:MAG: AMP-binding protein [Acidobacteriota bacterium]
MRVVHEGEGSAPSGDLDAAWEDPQTFAYLPRKSGGQGDWVARTLELVPEPLRRDHFALLSSGSTGEPKLVFGSRDRARRLARVLHDAQESEPVRRTVGLLPLTYSYAFVNQWLWAKEHGREFLQTAGFSDPEAVGQVLEHADDAMICLVAGHVPLLERQLAGRVFPGILRVHFAGGRFPQERLSAVSRTFPNAAIFNNYGCVEAMPRLTLRRAEAAESAADVGRPLPGVELRRSPGGALLFRSPYAAAGFCDSAGFHAIGEEDWVPTGDCGHSGEDGRWILEGRAGEVFKRYGVKISPPLVLDSVSSAWSGEGAFYYETDSLGEMGHVLLLAPHPGKEELQAILSVLRREHPRTHWPLRIESAPALPSLPNGKFDAAAASALEGRKIEWSQRI